MKKPDHFVTRIATHLIVGAHPQGLARWELPPGMKVSKRAQRKMARASKITDWIVRVIGILTLKREKRKEK